MRWQGDHARAHLSLARTHLHLFDLLQVTATNPMSLPNIRDAAIQSQSSFPTRQARDEWMNRAFGDHCRHLHRALWHTRRALALCPLQGKGYLYLAELCFLDGARVASKKAYVDQALRVRPFDGYVLYTAANEAWLAGDPAGWLEYSRQAFHVSDEVKKRLIDDLVGHANAEGLGPMIEFFLKEFQPDVTGLSYLLAAGKKHGKPQQLVGLRRHYAQTAERKAQSRDGAEAARYWLLAQQRHLELRDKTRAFQCAREAYACSPGEYRVRWALASSLIDQHRFAEAQEHLRWCPPAEAQRQDAGEDVPTDPGKASRFRQRRRRAEDAMTLCATGLASVFYGDKSGHATSAIHADVTTSAGGASGTQCENLGVPGHDAVLRCGARGATLPQERNVSTTLARSVSERLDPLGRQSPPLKKIFGNGPATHSAVGKGRLKMHWLPDRAGLDVATIHGHADVFPRGTEFLGVDRDAREPSRRHAGRVLGHEFDARQIAQFATIELEICPTLLHALIEHAELSPSDGGQQIAHAGSCSRFGNARNAVPDRVPGWPEIEPARPSLHRGKRASPRHSR